MNTTHNTRASLHWAFVGALAALIGFLSSRSLCAMWALNFVWLIVIGMIITIMVILIMYRPQDFLRALIDGIKASRRVIKGSFELYCQIKILWHLRRNRRSRTYRYKAMQATAIWGVCFFFTLCSWALPFYLIGLWDGINLQTILLGLITLITLRRCLTHWIHLGWYIPRMIVERRMYKPDRTYTVHYVDFSLHPERFKRRVCFRINTLQESSDNLLPGVIKKSNEIVRDHNRGNTPPCKTRSLFDRICYSHTTTGWKMLLKYNAACLSIRLAVVFFKKLCRVIDDLREFFRELLELFVYIYWKLNTTARRAIFICSVAGFFSGIAAELLGAHETAPYWCFATGFVFGFFQNYVFRCLQKRISIFLGIQMPQTA